MTAEEKKANNNEQKLEFAFQSTNRQLAFYIKINLYIP